MKAGRTWIKTLDAWGPHMPDWIDALANACDRSSQRKVAALLGVSPAVINLLINNKYAPRSHVEMEERVRNKLMVQPSPLCPVQGIITRQRCLEDQAKPLVINPLSVQLYRACRGGCEFFEGAK
jgi:hypothetical protein